MGEGLHKVIRIRFLRPGHDGPGQADDLNIVVESSHNSFHGPAIAASLKVQLQTSGLPNLACPRAERAKAFIYDQRGIVPARPGLLHAHNGSRRQPLSLAALPSS